MICKPHWLAACWWLVPIANLMGKESDAILRESVEQAVARVRPALVRIEVVTPDYSQGREVKYEASGSGVIISKDGYVITHHHVAGHATRLVCILSNNEEIEATLIGTDALADICVLKLKADRSRQFVPVDFGDSDKVRVGDTVLAMGSPLALSQSVTKGIVSNSHMIMPGSLGESWRFTLDGEDVGSIVRWIGHDAAIYPGNSGGPLVNMQGQVIGINEISLGLSGAIPSALARDAAQQLIKNGKVSRSWLGLELQPLLKFSNIARGALVSGVAADSPAADAGIRSGDILTRLNGKEINVRFREELPLVNQLIASLPMDQSIHAILLRQGQVKTVKCRAIERQPMESRTQELKQWGMTARNLSPMAARELKVKNLQGVLIISVRPGGPAGTAKPVIQANDIIRKANGEPVRSVQQLLDISKRLAENKTKPTPTMVELERKTEQYLTVVTVGLKEIEDPGLEVKKAWMPAGVQAITREMAEQLGGTDLSGVRVTQIFTDMTALPAGLQVGDLILAVDGEKIPATKAGDEEVFEAMIREYPVDAKPTLTVLRGREKLMITVPLQRTPKMEREMKKYRDENFEFTARDLSFFDKAREGWSGDVAGVLVTEVRDGGSAALAGLTFNDLIESVNDSPVKDVTSLRTKLKELADESPKFVVLQVLRGVHTRFLELETGWTRKITEKNER